MEIRTAKVLVAPLDWGLGHATRCIPVIRELIERGAEVLISASGGGKVLLTESFPQCLFIDIPGIKIRYPENGSMALSMLLQIPALLKAIQHEHELLQEVISGYGITHVVSDNRYGLYSKKAKSVFISHQVHIKSGQALKFLEPFLFQLNKLRIQKFDELWIPDAPPPNNLSETLSHTSGIAIPVRHLGLLSRFKKAAIASVQEYDFIALLSGPEPQRTLLELKLLEYFKTSGKKCLLVRGRPGAENIPETPAIKSMATISDEKLQNVLHPDTILICRPGYSTLMDLAIIGHRKTLFIPTPGQTEQEYLAHEIKSKYGYSMMRQQDDFLLQDVPNGKPLPELKNQDALQKAIRDFLS